MKANDLLDLIGCVDDRMIAEAKNREKKQNNTRIKWTAIAACICLVAASALIITGIRNTPVSFVPDTDIQKPPVSDIDVQNLPVSDNKATDAAELEPIVIPELNTGGMGFEGYLCYDISELNSGNPWSEDMHITSLPVYKNGAYDPSGAGIPMGLTEEKMAEYSELVAKALGIEVLSVEEIGKNGEAAAGETPTELRLKTDNGTVRIRADASVAYFLPDNGIELPDEYNFTFDSTTDHEAKDVLSYLIASYRDLLDYDEPKAITWGDYNIYGEFNRRYCAYDASGTDLEDILNFNFRGASFFPNGSGNLSSIRMSDLSLLAEKLGDYPIITAKEAKSRLTDGNYQTSVPTAFPGEEYIGKVELVYRTGHNDEVLLPYYRFYVMLTDVMDMDTVAEGLKLYGAYYVPAVADKYIVNLPVYDGTFN